MFDIGDNPESCLNNSVLFCMVQLYWEVTGNF